MSKYKRLLTPTDFSEVSLQAAVRAAELAGFYGSKLVFLHVVEHFPEHLPHYQMSGESMDPGFVSTPGARGCRAGGASDGAFGEI